MKVLALSLLATVITLYSCGQNENSKKETSNWDSLIPPRPARWVSDFEGNLLPRQVAYLDSIITLYEKETSNEIAIVSLPVDSSIVQSGKDFDDLSLSLFRK